MALFCRAGDEPPPRTLVRGFGFGGAGDRFFIAELALPLRKRADVVRQLEDVRFRSVSPFLEFMSARRGPQGHRRRVAGAPLLHVSLAAALRPADFAGDPLKVWTPGHHAQWVSAERREWREAPGCLPDALADLRACRGVPKAQLFNVDAATTVDRCSRTAGSCPLTAVARPALTSGAVPRSISLRWPKMPMPATSMAHTRPTITTFRWVRASALYNEWFITSLRAMGRGADSVNDGQPISPSAPFLD